MIRTATREDIPAMVSLVYELAEYERLVDQCHLTEDQLAEVMFGARPTVYGLVAVDDDSAVQGGDDSASQGGDDVVGMAIYFLNFSTWEGVNGIYLEDLYVRPHMRGKGFGKALLTRLAAECTRNGYRRLEWSVLDWNTPSIAFYESLGARPQSEWTTYRLTGDPLDALAATDR